MLALLLVWVVISLSYAVLIQQAARSHRQVPTDRLGTAMAEIAHLFEGMTAIAGRGDVEAALRCAKEILPARHHMEIARKLRQRTILMLADCAEVRVDSQLARRADAELRTAREGLRSRARALLSDISRFALADPGRIAPEQAARTAIIFQQALDQGSPARERRAPSLFISYRRADSAEITGFIAEGLTAEFGEGSIFMDVDFIPVGVNYRAFIVSTLARCKACLVVIGQDWADMRNGVGKRRIDEADDLVRVEVETALRIGVPVAPIFVRGARVPDPEELPAALSELSVRNGVAIRPHPDFDTDVPHGSHSGCASRSAERWIDAMPLTRNGRPTPPASGACGSPGARRSARR